MAITSDVVIITVTNV